MLEFKISGDILEVKETIIGFTISSYSYWYYNIKEWTCSLNGYKNEQPSKPMTTEGIEWVRKHYLPKIQKA